MSFVRYVWRQLTMTIPYMCMECHARMNQILTLYDKLKSIVKTLKQFCITFYIRKNAAL